MAYILKKNGKRLPFSDKITLDSLKQAVDGWIEGVTCFVPVVDTMGNPAFDDIIGHCQMIVNEEGWLKKLGINPLASIYAQVPISGDVVIMTEKEWNDAN